MTEALETYLRSMSDSQMRRHIAGSRKALRAAWPHRHDLRGGQVVRANVAMLRNCKEVATMLER